MLSCVTSSRPGRCAAASAPDCGRHPGAAAPPRSEARSPARRIHHRNLRVPLKATRGPPFSIPAKFRAAAGISTHPAILARVDRRAQPAITPATMEKDLFMDNGIDRRGLPQARRPRGVVFRFRTLEAGRVRRRGCRRVPLSFHCRTHTGASAIPRSILIRRRPQEGRAAATPSTTAGLRGLHGDLTHTTDDPKLRRTGSMSFATSPPG